MRIGSQEPTVLWVPPSARSSAGEEALALARECGVRPDPWQELCVEMLLRELPDGRWAGLEAAVELARQNGKNVVLEIIEAAALVLFGERLVTHSAHLFTTSMEHFARMRLWFERPPLADLLDDVRVANGKEQLVLRGGRRLRFVARTHGASRGFTAERLVYDEAFSLDRSAQAAMMPALSARSMESPGPQVLYASSPAHPDSAVLHSVRRRALDGDTRVVYVGWVHDSADPDDVDVWYAANPALGIRISEDWVRAERQSLDTDDFLRERCGVPMSEDAAEPLFGAGGWQDCRDAGSSIDGPVTLCVDVTPEMTRAAVGAAGRRPDGLWHVEVVDHRPGTDWLAARLCELSARWETPIRYDPSGPVSVLVGRLESAGVPLSPVAGGLSRSCGVLQELVVSRQIRHIGQEPLDRAVAGAKARMVGDRLSWARRSAKVDLSPLVAVTLAVAAAVDHGADVTMAVW